MSNTYHQSKLNSIRALRMPNRLYAVLLLLAHCGVELEEQNVMYTKLYPNGRPRRFRQ